MACRAQSLSRGSVAVLIALLLAVGQSPLKAASPPSPPAETPLPAPDGPVDWWAVVRADLEQAEYAVTWQEQTYLADLPAAYQAPNRAQGLRTYFTATGISIIPRMWDGDAAAPPWRLDLRLDAWGPAGDTRPVDPATSEVVAPGAAASGAVDNRVEVRRGPLVESYRNDAEGLTVGLRLDAAPARTPSTPVRPGAPGPGRKRDNRGPGWRS
jgi:hypothetical protein